MNDFKLACIMADIDCANRMTGRRKMLNKARETNALLALRYLSSLMLTYVAKVAKATCKINIKHRKLWKKVFIKHSLIS